MSLTISISTQEGIVLAADSRQTYRNNVRAARIGSDSATKIFSVHEKIGVTVAGPAFLPDPDHKGSIKGIQAFVKEVIDQIGKADTVSVVADKLRKRLEEVYNPTEQLNNGEKDMMREIKATGGKFLRKEISPQKDALMLHYTDAAGNNQQAMVGVIPITLIVAGYDKDGGSVFLVNIPGDKIEKRASGKANQYGADWTGQTDLITRVVRGFDPRIDALDFVQAAGKNMGPDKILSDLNSLEYIINWGAMTLHDAVDFATLMIETTSAIQRFSDGIKLAPGDIPGVGGAVDVAVILPDSGFHWSQKKKLPLEKPVLD